MFNILKKFYNYINKIIAKKVNLFISIYLINIFIYINNFELTYVYIFLFIFKYFIKNS